VSPHLPRYRERVVTTAGRALDAAPAAQPDRADYAEAHSAFQPSCAAGCMATGVVASGRIEARYCAGVLIFFELIK
jgi:hypothetical protein